MALAVACRGTKPARFSFFAESVMEVNFSAARFWHRVMSMALAWQRTKRRQYNSTTGLAATDWPTAARIWPTFTGRARELPKTKKKRQSSPRKRVKRAARSVVPTWALFMKTGREQRRFNRMQHNFTSAVATQGMPQVATT